MAKLRILSAKAGVFRGRTFKPLKRNSKRRNAAEGFFDARGVFHSIEKSIAGLKPKKKKAAKKRKKPNAKKRAPKKSVKKRPTVKRAAKAKRKRSK